MINPNIDMARATELVFALLDAVERGDLQSIRPFYSTNARIWHNHDEVDQTLEEVIEMLSGFAATTSSIRYLDRRVWTSGNSIFSQHVLVVTFPSGKPVRIPATLRLEIGPTGLVQRLEEYLDPSPLLGVSKSA